MNSDPLADSLAAGLHNAIVDFHKVLHQRQPDAESALCLGGGVVYLHE